MFRCLIFALCRAPTYGLSLGGGLGVAWHCSRCHRQIGQASADKRYEVPAPDGVEADWTAKHPLGHRIVD